MGSSVCGIFQARILEWVVISFSRGFSWPRNQICEPTSSTLAILCLVTQSCPTLCNPGSSVHGDSLGKNTAVGCHALLQGSSQSRDQTQVSCIAGKFFTVWATTETYIGSQILYHRGSRWFSGKESACNAGDTVSVPGSGRFPGEGNGNPFQYSYLGNFMDRGAWWATVHGVTKESTLANKWQQLCWCYSTKHNFLPAPILILSITVDTVKMIRI